MLEGYRLPHNLMDYTPFPPAHDRAGWAGLPEDTRAALVRRGEEYLGFSWPAITAADWLAYTRTGNRVDFEDKYFARRRALCALILAECAEYQGRFLDEAANGILLLCEESGWQLPAHNSYIRNTPALPLPCPTRPVLDLFACETGTLLATAVYLLDRALAEVCPILGERVGYELEHRIVTPYLTEWFWWMGGRGEPTLNWTVWCTQNVLLAAFLGHFSGDIRRRTVLKATESLDAFLRDYGEDGCCDEGAQYYRHAGLCLFGALEVLDRVTQGQLEAVWKEQKIKNIAHYILNVHVQDRYYVNFADCSPIAGRAGVREYLFGARCGDGALCDFAAADWQNIEHKDLPEEINLFYRAQAAFSAREVSGHKPAGVRHCEVYYQSVGLFVARDDTYCLAVKAGDNDDNHNHNDTGSFTLYKNGRPFVIDVGVESYSAKTFSGQRYEIWTMQSSYHNLPDFDGVMQSAGAQFRAKEVQTAFGERESVISLRLEDAWPKESGLFSFGRRVRLLKNRCVVVEDCCAGSFRASVLNLMFCEKPLVSEGRIMLEGLGEILLQGAQDVTGEEIPITDARLLTAWPKTLYRVRVMFDGALRFEIY